MNILLVEDEPPILRDIQYTIESYNEDYTILAALSDGQTAMDFLEKNHGNIDVLITDIHIPLIDGLELISYVREHMPHIYCIIITGFSQFEYAKKAVQLKVVDYLLKPINEKELITLLKQIYSKWCMDCFCSEKNICMDTLINKENSYCYGLAIISIGSISNYSSVSSSDQEKWESCRLEDLFSNHSELIHDYYIMEGLTPHEKNILFIFNKNIVITDQIFETIFHNLLDHPYTITIVINHTINNLYHIKNHLESLRLFLMEHIILERTQILIYQKESSTSNSFDNSVLTNELSGLLKLFYDLNVTLFETELKQFLLKMKALSLPQFQVAKYLRTLIDMCILQYRTIENIYIISTDKVVQQCLYQSDTYSALFQNLKLFFYNIFNCIMAETPLTVNKRNILIHIDHYISKNCYQQINTKSIAEKFGFTPAYLSKIFQEYKNITPMDYILQLRIEKAIELFNCNPALMIKDVSAHVGYSDSLYFSKVFKKYTGLSPKQYLRKLRQN